MKNWKPWQLGLLALAIGPAVAAFISLFALFFHAFTKVFMFMMLLVGFPIMIYGLLLILGIFKDFEDKAMPVLYFGTLLVGYELSKVMHGHPRTPYECAFIFALAVTLAWYFGWKAKRN